MDEWRNQNVKNNIIISIGTKKYRNNSIWNYDKLHCHNSYFWARSRNTIAVFSNKSLMFSLFVNGVTYLEPQNNEKVRRHETLLNLDVLLEP